MNFGSVAFLFCTSLFLLLGIFLLGTKRAWKFGMQWLGILFICLAINYLDGILFLNGFYLNYPHFAFIEDPLVLLYGPFLLFFSAGMQQKAWRNKNLIHLIPFILSTVFTLYGYHLLPLDSKLEILRKVDVLNLPPQFIWVTALVFAHVFTYGLLARKQILSYKETLRGYYSSVEIDWASRIVDLILVILSISLVATFLEATGQESLYMNALIGTAMITTILTLRIILRAMKEPIFSAPREIETGQKLDKTLETKIIDEINTCLAEKIYQNAELSLEDISKAVGYPARQVSHVINKSMADNFYDLINKARIKEASILLESESDMNISEIMYESGFNSKSSFNTQFKKVHGRTPSAYRKELNKKGSNT